MLNTFQVLRTYWKESFDFKEEVMHDCDLQTELALFA